MQENEQNPMMSSTGDAANPSAQPMGQTSQPMSQQYPQYSQQSPQSQPQSQPQPQQQPQQPPYNQQHPYMPPQASYGYAGAQPYQQQYYPPYMQGVPGMPVREPVWNTLCIIGFALVFVVAPVGLILSIIALIQMRRTGEKSRVMAICGIVFGSIFSLIWLIVMLLMSFGMIYYMQHVDEFIHDFDTPSCELDGTCEESVPYGKDEDGQHGDAADYAAGQGVVQRDPILTLPTVSVEGGVVRLL